jgi:hypothetical protein
MVTGKELKPAKVRIPEMVGIKPNLKKIINLDYRSTDLYKNGTRDVWALKHFGQKEYIQEHDEDN